MVGGLVFNAVVIGLAMAVTGYLTCKAEAADNNRARNLGVIALVSQLAAAVWLMSAHIAASKVGLL